MPLDGTHLEEWQTTLLKAAEIVRERWGQGKFGVAGGPRCAFGAIAEAMRSESSLIIIDSPASMHLRSAFPMGNASEVINWNDAPDRTAEEVASTMERVALAPITATVE